MPVYAAVDIGSNSVRLLAANVENGAVTPFAKERQVTRLGASVFRTGRLSEESMDFVCGQLARLAQLYQRYDPLAVRAVATAAVRDASNQEEFLERATAALGAPVEVISGQEEARLVHLGVQLQWPHPKQRILVIDIGGGSCELILAEQGETVEALSKPLGAVRLTEVFLKNDPPTAADLHRLDRYIEERLAVAWPRLARGPIDRVIATSSSAAAVVSAANDIPRSKRDQADKQKATVKQIRQLYQQLSTSNLAERRKLPWFGPRRSEIIVPGVAVFLRVLEHLQLPALFYSGAGVREGIVADLAARGVGRELSRLDKDQRRTVEALSRRYGVQPEHSRKVAALAGDLFDGFQKLHGLDRAYGKLLEAAAYLHDVGHFVSDTGHHKHSYYVVSHSDLPGFTEDERHLIAQLCRYHRKSMPGPKHECFQLLAPEQKQALLRLIPLLRLADSLDQSHEQRVACVRCEMKANGAQVLVESDQDISLEQWGADRAAAIFEGVYARPLAVLKVRPNGGER